MYTTPRVIITYKYNDAVYIIMLEEYDKAQQHFERDFPYKYKCVDCGDICRSRVLTGDAVCPQCGGGMKRMRDRPQIIVAVSDMD